jgi:hypothetical protein
MINDISSFPFPTTPTPATAHHFTRLVAIDQRQSSVSLYSTARTMASLRIARLPRQLSRRTFSISARHSTSFKSGPAPPRLPRDEQELFEKLQKQSTGAFSTPQPSPSTKPNIRMQINQSPDSSPSASRPQINQSPDSTPEIRFENGKEIKKGDEVHPNMRRGAPPEFEGERNPKTGEVGGPKNDPLRWGGSADWSYNGRVTDF